jgi:hypothetical protein
MTAALQGSEGIVPVSEAAEVSVEPVDYMTTTKITVDDVSEGVRRALAVAERTGGIVIGEKVCDY